MKGIKSLKCAALQVQSLWEAEVVLTGMCLGEAWVCVGGYSSDVFVATLVNTALLSESNPGRSPRQGGETSASEEGS